jgi:hypothetical protein
MTSEAQTGSQLIGDGDLVAKVERVMRTATRRPVVTADGPTLARWTVEALERQREAGE